MLKRKNYKILQNLISLGLGDDKDLKIDVNGTEIKGKIGFEVTTLYSEEIAKRYEWCYLMERIYLFKHIEILQVTVNICYLMNSLFVIYYFFSKIIKLRDII